MGGANKTAGLLAGLVGTINACGISEIRAATADSVQVDVY